MSDAPLRYQDAHELMELNPRTLGALRWKDPRFGNVSEQGRVSFYGTGRWFGMSRIVWLWHTGTWPPSGRIVHRNGNPFDYRFENLFLPGASDVQDVSDLV